MVWPWGNLVDLYTLLTTPIHKQKEQKSADASTPKPSSGPSLLDYVVMCHVGHSTDFCVALICYFFCFPIEQAAELKFGWIAQVYLFNLAVELVFYGGWHWMLYSSPFSKREVLKEKKYNPENQYAEGTTNLQREITYTTLGFLQSATFQVVVMHLWASGRIPYYNDFWKYPVYSLGWLFFVTYWREFHFYWAHRMMHPWRRKLPIVGDVGDFLYKNVHKLHHKSFNTGPFSGLSMHPVEHFLYYSVTLTCLFVPMHPIHFLYCKFHADIAPIGGHDGYAKPGGDAGFHYLHHAKYECNYGVPLVDFDRLFGTWQEYDDYARELKAKKVKGK